ncbi:bifunctional folylpolyglutamate synthase/dihydrofolate synthase [Piscibacillus sp. B03]|uniref:bifunctional folylpolyglutamate synthase/dihydrofolate synthase n=1 Tax=Piscibacillus sp. B03 TaxID=3457430 RepID=UPI003FCC614C
MENKEISWLKEQLKVGIKPGLDRVKLLLQKLGHPEKKLKIIHIAGTNGKGSTLTFLRNILSEHSYEVGTFTSPYIEHYNERISINGSPISDDEMSHYIKLLKPLCNEISLTEFGKPTEFEIVTCIALQYFKDKNVDYVILEAGLGGRMDSTNVVNPLLSIITMIGYDHLDVLGDSIEEIATEKAGIIKPNAPVFTNEIKSEAFHVLESKAKQTQSSIYRLHKDFDYSWGNSYEDGEEFNFISDELTINGLRSTMTGKHQIENASLAIYSAKKLSELEGIFLSIEKIIKSIERTTWVGRFEFIHRNPTIILDGAHNVEAFEQLIDTINNRYNPSHIKLLISVIKGKPIEPIIDMLSSQYEDITITSFDFDKSYSKKELLQKFYKCDIIVSENWKSTVNDFIDQQETNEVLVVTGSLYFISVVRSYLNGR